MFKRLSLALTLLIPLVAPPAFGQPSESPSEAAALEAFREKFAKDVLDSCLKSSKSETLNIPVKSYCRCYSQIFASKYSAQEVAYINRFVVSSPANTEAAQIFLAPMNRLCLK